MLFLTFLALPVLLHSILASKAPELQLVPKANRWSNFIHQVASSKSVPDTWISIIDSFFLPYQKLDPGREDRVNCRHHSPGEKQACSVSTNEFGPCNRANSYGYRSYGSLCVFLTLEQVYGWVPNLYNSSAELPAALPPQDQNEVRQGQEQGTGQLLWLTCEGSHPADAENVGPLAYFPEKGFRTRFLPFRNQAGYLSPVVAVFLQKPKVGVVITLTCRVWAQNIDHDSREGIAEFQVLIDD